MPVSGHRTGGYSFEDVTNCCALDRDEAQELVNELITFIQEDS